MRNEEHCADVPEVHAGGAKRLRAEARDSLEQAARVELADDPVRRAPPERRLVDRDGLDVLRDVEELRDVDDVGAELRVGLGHRHVLRPAGRMNGDHAGPADEREVRRLAGERELARAVSAHEEVTGIRSLQIGASLHGDPT